MMGLAREIIGTQPILAAYLAIGRGYLVGQINLGGFSGRRGRARDFAENPFCIQPLVSWRTGALVISSNVSFVLRLEFHLRHGCMLWTA